MKGLILAFLAGANLAIWIPVMLAETPEAETLPEPPAPITAPNLPDLVRIRSLEDVRATRAEILHHVFGEPELPMTAPASVEPFENERFAGRRLVIPVGDELQEGYLLEPIRPGAKPRLAIYHAGHHEHALTDGADAVDALLEAGFHVLALSMLPGDHQRFEALERPLAAFLEHVAVGLNYALAESDFETVIMLGLSGGGWTAVLYAALDPRIDRSFPIAASYPQYLREQLPDSVGDFEQRLPGLDVDYLDLYMLASSEGREQIQIFSLNDPCCFSGGHAMTYRDFVAERARELGGRFDVVVEATDRHDLSPGLLALLLSLR